MTAQGHEPMRVSHRRWASSQPCPFCSLAHPHTHSLRQAGKRPESHTFLQTTTAQEEEQRRERGEGGKEERRRWKQRGSKQGRRGREKVRGEERRGESGGGCWNMSPRPHKIHASSPGSRSPIFCLHRSRSWAAASTGSRRQALPPPFRLWLEPSCFFAEGFQALFS